MLAKELDLYVSLLPKIVAEGVSSTELLIYRMTITSVTITNLRGQVQVHSVSFIVSDLRRYKVYLSLL